MNLKIARNILSFGISLFGFLVPILPRFYMIHMRSSNPERLSDVFSPLHAPGVYQMTVFPFIFLSLIAWFSLRKSDLSRESVIKRVSGIIVAFIVIGYWGLMVSMPFVWGVAAGYFFIGSIFILPLVYEVGGLIGLRIFQSIFPDTTLPAKESENRKMQIKESKSETTLEEMFRKSREAKNGTRKPKPG